MAETHIRVKLIVHRKEMADQLVYIIDGTEGFKAVQKNSSQRPDLIIFELNDPDDFTDVQSLAGDEGTDDIFIIGESKNPDLLMRAMRAGVKDFFAFPIKTEEIREALYRFKKRQEQVVPQKQHKKNTIVSITGSKGGVGTTTVAVNLAAALAQDGAHTVCLVDMNTLFGEIPLFLDMVPQFSWADVIQNISRLDDTFLMNILSRHKSGMHILPAPGSMENHMIPDSQAIERWFRVMRTMFDFIVIDLGQMMDEKYIKTMQLSDKVLLIATQTLPCLTNTNRLMKSLMSYGFLEKDRIHVVLNRYIKKSEITLKSAETAIEKDLYFVFPNDYNTCMSAINNGETLLEKAPTSEVAKSYMALAEKMSPNPLKQTDKKKNFFFWR